MFGKRRRWFGGTPTGEAARRELVIDARIRDNRAHGVRRKASRNAFRKAKRQAQRRARRVTRHAR